MHIFLVLVFVFGNIYLSCGSMTKRSKKESKRKFSHIADVSEFEKLHKNFALCAYFDEFGVETKAANPINSDPLHYEEVATFNSDTLDTFFLGFEAEKEIKNNPIVNEIDILAQRSVLETDFRTEMTALVVDPFKDEVEEGSDGFSVPAELSQGADVAENKEKDDALIALKNLQNAKNIESKNKFYDRFITNPEIQERLDQLLRPSFDDKTSMYIRLLFQLPQSIPYHHKQPSWVVFGRKLTSKAQKPKAWIDILPVLIGEGLIITTKDGKYARNF